MSRANGSSASSLSASGSCARQSFTVNDQPFAEHPRTDDALFEDYLPEQRQRPADNRRVIVTWW